MTRRLEVAALVLVSSLLGANAVTYLLSFWPI